METRDLSGSLVVMLTYACQLRCGYCEVRKSPRAMNWETLRAAVDLLWTADRDDLQLRYFGGEPLLRFDLIRRAVAYAESLRSRSSRKIRHMITTNGLLLDQKKIDWLRGHDVEIMLSADGSSETSRRQRPAASGRDYHRRLRSNLRVLQRSRIPYFINVVVTPEGQSRALEDLRLLASWGVARAQICYQVAAPWDRAQKARLGAFLEDAVRESRRSGGMEILNAINGCEPVMLSDEILVDTDGVIYLDAAVFLERRFPRLRQALRLGRVGDGARLGELRRTKSEILRLATGIYPSNTVEGKLFLNNVGVGLDLGRRMDGLRREGAAP